MRPLGIIFILISIHSVGQRIRYGLDVGYVSTKYSFPVAADVYHTKNLKSFSSVRGGAMIYLMATKTWRIGIGVQYLSMSGTRDAGHVKVNANQNSIGTLLFHLDNSYLIYPLESSLDLTRDTKITPFVSFGFSFFTPLKENIHVEIVPDNPYQYSEMYSLTIDKNTSEHQLFGFFAGLGVRTAMNEKHELSLSANYRMNTSYYRTRTEVSTNVFEVERHHIKFNMFDVMLCWTMKR